MSKKKKPTEAVRIKSEIVDRARNIAVRKDVTIRSVLENELKNLPK